MKFLLSILILITISSCNNKIELEPVESQAQESTKPDFNLITRSQFTSTLKDTTGNYKMLIEMYLRPFQGVSDSSNFIMSFTSNNFSKYIVLNDTLLNGDKKIIPYSSFNKFLLYGLYESKVPGSNEITLSFSLNTITKSNSITIKHL